MSVQVLDYSLDNFKVPGIPGYTPPFGTKKLEGTGLNTIEIARNEVMPFLKQRPISGVAVDINNDPPLGIISQDSIASPIEFDAKFSVDAGVILQIGDPAYEGQELTIVSSFSIGESAAIVMGVSGIPKEYPLEAGGFYKFIAVNGNWKNFIEDTFITNSLTFLYDPLNPIKTFTVPDGVTEIRVTACAGGGGGKPGGTGSSGSIGSSGAKGLSDAGGKGGNGGDGGASGAGGAGGGYGNFVISEILEVTNKETITITIGAGGASNTNGGTTSIISSKGNITLVGGLTGAGNAGNPSTSGSAGSIGANGSGSTVGSGGKGGNGGSGGRSDGGNGLVIPNSFFQSFGLGGAGGIGGKAGTGGPGGTGGRNKDSSMLRGEPGEDGSNGNDSSVGTVGQNGASPGSGGGGGSGGSGGGGSGGGGGGGGIAGSGFVGNGGAPGSVAGSGGIGTAGGSGAPGYVYFEWDVAL